jgi:hypothetical protein
MPRPLGRTVVGAVLLAALLAACNPAVPPQQNYATIYGTVYDGATGQPLPGASVTVDAVLTATTGSDGTYTVTTVPIGPFTAIESANGYQQHQDQGSVAAGDRYLLNATLYK